MNMQPSDNDELTDRELDAILPEWKTPVAPARLRAALFPEVPRPWWRRLWTSSIRIPLPVACLLAVVLMLAAWRWLTPRTIYRDRLASGISIAAAGTDASQLRPVTELRPRIVRRADAQN
jgi:hypothetical protein